MSRDFIYVVRIFFGEHIWIPLLTILGIPFVICYILSSLFFNSPLSEDDLKKCEYVAQRVYEQTREDSLVNFNFPVEQPENINVEESSTAIVVTIDGHSGKLVAQVVDGSLLFVHEKDNFDRIMKNCICGFFIPTLIFITLFLCNFYIKIFK